MIGIDRAYILFCILLVIPFTGFAEIYKYRDSEGRLTFVDDKDKIPVEYRQESKSMPENNDSLGSYDSLINIENTRTESFEKQTSPINASGEKKLDKSQTPVVIKGNRVLVPVEAAMGNRVAKLSLLLDTGATTTVFHRSSLSELDLPNGRTYKARVAGGGIVKSVKIKFRHIAIGPFKIKKAPAMVINLKGKEVPFDGMLGMDFLKDHPYKVDFDKQVITWEVVD